MLANRTLEFIICLSEILTIGWEGVLCTMVVKKGSRRRWYFFLCAKHIATKAQVRTINNDVTSEKMLSHRPCKFYIREENKKILSNWLGIYW